MRGMMRGFTCAATVVTALAVVLACVAPANAQYKPQPLSLAWHPAGPVHSSVSRDGVVYLGGKLDGTGGIAAVDAGTGDLLWLLPTNDDVRALALSDDGSRLFGGGSFTAVDGQTRKHLVAINVADHAPVAAWKGTASGVVRDLVVNGDTLFVAGKFSSIAGATSKGIGAVSATTGARITSFNHSVDLGVMGLALTSDRLILSGTFTQVDGQHRASLAAIDLSTYALTSWAPPRFCPCDTYWDVQTAGSWAYVGASGSGGGNFAAFNLDTGAQRWPYVHADGDVQTVWLPGDGMVYVGGHFGQQIYRTGSPHNVVTATSVAALNPVTGFPNPTFTPKIYKTYPGVWALTSTSSRLWVGGDFTGELQNTANNHKPYLAAYPETNGTVDSQPPTGTFTTSPTRAWAGSTAVLLVHQGIHDNVTPNNLIDRRVDWGDGSTVDWTPGTTLSHVYQTTGTFSPTVTLIDQAGNVSDPLAASPVVVRVDSVAPVLTLRLPRHHQHSVRAWQTLRGTAIDHGSGVRTVSVKAIEKRGAVWYAYHAKRHLWVKATTKAAAFAHSQALIVPVNSKHRWAGTLAHLRKGDLLYRVWSKDQVKNRSVTLTQRAQLTHL
jgi:hypothetical protein